MSALKSECRKFSPNMFNKTKCQNCFRTKDVHSAEALENNRASRNVSKCGYLFVAPDWDFNVSVNRTKRWQRRWFVLYDDGELTYALDEFPDTIPQSTIDMNKVLDVSDAESVTGNDFSIAITAPDKVHFIKGTSKEESKWWFDVLSRVLPRHLARGKHKRNATFPCGKATIPPPAVISQDYCSEDDLRLRSFTRPKFLSSSEIHRSEDSDWPSVADADEDVFPADSINERDSDGLLRDVEVNNAINKLDLVSESTNGDDNGLQEENIPSEIVQNDGGPQPDEIDIRRKNRRYLKRENRVQRNQRTRFDGVSKMIPSKSRQDRADPSDTTTPVTSTPTLATADKQEYLETILVKEEESTASSSDLTNGKEVASTVDMLSPIGKTGCLPTKTNLRKSESLKNIPSESRSEVRDQVSGLRRYHSFRGSSSQRKTKSSASSHVKNKSPSPRPTKTSPTPMGNVVSSDKNTTQVQDTPTLEMCDELHTEGAFTRTGWLLRQTLTKEWSRHWYVLRDSSLSYYRDPSAEHCGIMDGILDLNQVSNVQDTESERYFAFKLLTWDGKKHVLAAETEELKRTWVQTIQYASNLWSLASKEDFIRSDIVLPEHNFHQTASPIAHGDDDKPLETSSSSDDQSEYFSLVDEDEDTLCSIHRDEDIDATLSLHQAVYGNNDSCDLQIPEVPNINRKLVSTHEHTSEESLFNPDIQKSRFSLPNHLFDRPSSVHSFRAPAASDVPPDGCYMCVKVRSRLIAAKEEIRRLKNELREAHANFDNLEMFSYKLKQDMKSKEDNYDSQIALMSAKIDDLTSKFSLAERNYRQLKQKLAKGEYRLEKRKSSLKNKETLSLSKEYESKLSELENKIVGIESSLRKESSEAGESQLYESEEVKSESLPETSGSAETNSSEHSRGFLSRLQSLGERVEHVSDLVTENAENTQNPKICVQLRESEGSSSLDESEDWRTLSLTSTLSNLQSLDEPVFDLPRNLSECRTLFAQKTNKLLEWFKNSLDHICKQENDAGAPDKKCLLMANISEVVDYLYYAMPDEIRKSGTRSMCYTILLFVEFIKVMEKIDTFENVDLLTRFNVTGWAFRIIGKTLCIAFTETNRHDFLEVLNLVSDIPQIRYFCPLVSKLLTESEENHISNDLERLQQFTEQYTHTTNLLEEAKNARFKSLWDTLSEIPVQDVADRKSQKVNPMFKYVTSVCSSIYGISESQLSAVQSQSLYILKSEHDALHSWCSDTRQALELSFGKFLEGLKERCPMINESSIPVPEQGTSTFKEITSLVSQLSFLYVSSVILETTFSHLNKSERSASRSCVPYENWISTLQKNYLYKTNCVSDDDFFECSQCTSLNCLLSDTDKHLNWVDYLQADGHPPKKRTDCLKFEVEHLQSALNKASSNSAINFPPDAALGKVSKEEASGWICAQCERLQGQLAASERQRQEEIQEVERNFRLELETVEQRLQKNNEVYQLELRERESELDSSKAQLQRMKVEYEEQIQNLKNLYEQEIHFEHENIDEDTIRQMYKAEIEDIKGMFKRGLLAIQNSHNRITSEMEKRHKDEMAQLEIEKQKALELEAQATVTALEAIKKFHAKQLVEETTNLKEELINKFQTAGQCEDFICKYGSELEELKAEILKITEKYSAKCQETVALEAKVSSLRQKLKEAHNELSQLLNKNQAVDLPLLQN